MELSLPEKRQAFVLAVLTIGFYYERIKLCEHCVVSHHNGRIETEGVREQYAEDIYKWLDKTAQCGPSEFELFPKGYWGHKIKRDQISM
jgi:hypothetical protein